MMQLDQQKNKKQALIVYMIALVITVLMVVPMIFEVLFDLYSGERQELSLSVELPQEIVYNIYLPTKK